MFDPELVLRDSSVLLTEAEVQQTLDGMARDIASDLFFADPVVVAVMNGGAFTAIELCRRFRFPFEFDYVHATRYGSSLSGGDLNWQVPPRKTLSGRIVLIVDDILDQGKTLKALTRALADVGVAESKTAVLVARENSAEGQRQVDYIGQTIGDGYVFGCGMDYKGYWRGLPELRVATNTLEGS